MSEDINVTDGTVLETLNNKVDLDGGNYVGIPLEDYVHKHCLNEKITNCLLEVPQRIKYDLTDGTLTIKASSVVIVPYGTEDRTSEFPVGATFINENFKVYDTQYVSCHDGISRFFVWAEMIEDVPHVVQGTSTETGVEFIDLTTNSGTDWGTTGCGSGTTARTDNGYQYYTNTNFVKKHSSGVANAEVYSLPIMITSKTKGVPTKINQVFKVMGCFVSVFWVDKGIKALVPDFKNEDGTYKNIEWENNIFSFHINTLTNRQKQVMFFDIKDNMCAGLGARFSNDVYNHITYELVYDNSLNGYFYSYNTSDNYTLKKGLIVAYTTIDANGVYTALSPKQAFRAVDYNDYVNIVSSPITALCTTRATTTSSASNTKPAVVVQNYVAGTSWYRVWSDGWIEQGGVIGSNQINTVTVTFLKPFRNTDYFIVKNYGSAGTGTAGDNEVSFYGRTTTSVQTFSADKDNATSNWYACGY